MQAVVFIKPGHLQIETLPDPEISSDEVVVKVKRAGICGTDVHLFSGEYPGTFPLIAGHEFMGEVVEAGKSVTHLKAGDRVTVDPNISCGHCYYCHREQANHCLNWQAIGVTRPGAFAQFTAVPAKVCYKIPDSLSDVEAAFIEPLSCVVYALNRLQSRVGQDVLILGAGPMGLLLVQALKFNGAARIVVLEKQAHRRKLAVDSGAHFTTESFENLQKELAVSMPFGADIIIDASGVTSLIEKSFRFLKPGGTFLQFGVTSQNSTIKVHPYKMFRNDWIFLGSFALKFTFEQSLAWIKSGHLAIDSLISNTFPLNDFQKGFEAFRKGEALKVHIIP